MKTLISFLVIFFLLPTSCNRVEVKNAQIKKQENPREINKLINGKRFYVKDSSLYSQLFIRKLQYSLDGSCDSMILINDTLFLYTTTEYKERIYHERYRNAIPNDLPLGKQVIYKADQDGKKYSMTLLRTNLTEVAFTLDIDGERTRSGVVILGVAWYFADEGGYIDENGEMYGSVQYLSENYFDETNKVSSVRLTIQRLSGEHAHYSDTFVDDKLNEINVILRRE